MKIKGKLNNIQSPDASCIHTWTDVNGNDKSLTNAEIDISPEELARQITPMQLLDITVAQQNIMIPQSQECSCEKPNYGLGHCFNFGKPIPEPKYACADCGKLRTKDEGGTTFTVCDECWKKKYPPEPKKECKREPEPKKIEKLVMPIVVDSHSANNLILIRDKINELIKLVNERER